MKKEIKKVDVSLDKDIQDSIEKNARKGWLEYNLERERRHKREKIKNKVILISTIAFVLLVTCLLLLANSKLTNEAQKNCINAGYSENYCYENL